MQAMEIVEVFFVYQHGDEIEKMHHYALQLQAWAICHQLTVAKQNWINIL